MGSEPRSDSRSKDEASYSTAFMLSAIRGLITNGLSHAPRNFTSLFAIVCREEKQTNSGQSLNKQRNPLKSLVSTDRDWKDLQVLLPTRIGSVTGLLLFVCVN
ncbi:hypothetical protein LOK49_LG07G03454 [Camellia lanceoleosa]|uniref:Uncharacterized protein n=1 Tax=Camellia lanceoleosa TaxID=1840588 RepID=A0ACC0H4C7_9ERIC|nr:hypothetical protein LOK49_LG07G03454 [Camellia lanceoleosa]